MIVQIEQFKKDLTALINNSNLPIEIIFLIMQYITSQLELLYMQKYQDEDLKEKIQQTETVSNQENGKMTENIVIYDNQEQKENEDIKEE